MNNIIFNRALFCALCTTSLMTTIPSYASEALQEIVVTASRVETPLREIGASISVITKEDIELQGYQNVADVLRTQPGVAVSNSGGQGKLTTIRIRGEEGYRTLIVIDGIDVSDPSGTQVSPQAAHIVTTGDIERMEVLRGPQGFIYGADAGGVVNIITQSSEQGLNGQVSLETGRYNSRKVNAFIAGANHVGGAFVSISDSRTDGFDLSEFNSTWSLEEDGYKNDTIHSKFYLNLSDALSAQLVVRDTSSFNEYDSCGYPLKSDNCEDEYDQTAGRLSLNYQNSDIQHALAIQQNSIERVIIEEGERSYSVKGGMKKLEYLGGKPLTEVLSAVWGGDFEKEHVTTGSFKQYDRDQAAVFGELRVAVKSSLYTSLGLRIDDNEDFGTHASVRLSTAYIQTLANQMDVKYRASYGTGYRAPSLSEISYNNESLVEMAALTEESSSGFDIGLDFYLRDGLVVQFTYFDQMIEDEIGFDLVAWTGYLQLVGIAHSKGIELNLEYPLSRYIDLLANYTYNETLTRDDRQRIRRPKSFGNLAGRFSSISGKLNFLLSARFSKDAVNEAYGVEGQQPLDDYNVIDVSVNYLLENNMTLFARIENAADKHYQEVTGYDAAEAAFYVGLKARF